MATAGTDPVAVPADRPAWCCCATVGGLGDLPAAPARPDAVRRVDGGLPGWRVDPAGRQVRAVGRECAVRETVARRPESCCEPDDLRPWAHWITPEIEPRRYDT